MIFGKAIDFRSSATLSNKAYLLDKSENGINPEKKQTEKLYERALEQSEAKAVVYC